MKLIVFELCDNDYGHDLKEAVTLAAASGLYERAGEDCVWWKLAVVKLTVGIQALNWHSPLAEPYLMDRLQVYFTDKFPTYDGEMPLDHGGGSVMLDLTRGFVTTF